MQELRKFVAPEYVFGAGARSLAGQYAVNYGARRVLVVSDPGVVASGWFAEVVKNIEAHNVETIPFTDVTANPKDHEAMAGAERYLRHNCDVIVAVGGGSPMDCAKGVGVICGNGGFINEYEGVDVIEHPGPPLICIPTTAGSSADVSQFAIITNTVRQVKIALISKMLVPDVSLIDAETLLTKDPALTAATGMDALTHAIESFVSSASSYSTDLHALDAIRILSQYVPLAVKHGDNPEYREKTMLGSMQAGLAFSNASLGAVHAMAHAAGGLTDAPHGDCNAILLSRVVNYNFATSPDRYRMVAEAMGLAAPGMSSSVVKERLVQGIMDIAAECGVTYGLKSIGVTEQIIPQLAANALADPCMVTNPRRPTQQEIEDLYASAL